MHFVGIWKSLWEEICKSLILLYNLFYLQRDLWWIINCHLLYCPSHFCILERIKREHCRSTGLTKVTVYDLLFKNKVKSIFYIMKIIMFFIQHKGYNFKLLSLMNKDFLCSTSLIKKSKHITSTSFIKTWNCFGNQDFVSCFCGYI